jgi:hypothetical protein
LPTLDDVVSGGGTAAEDEEVIANFDEAVEFEAVPKGVYNATIKSVTPKKSGEKSAKPGSPMLDWCFVITEAGELKNRLVFRNTMLTGKGSGFLKGFLKGIGEEAAAKGDQKLTPSEWIGRAVVIEVGPSNLPDRSEVKSVSLPKSSLA